MLTFNLVNFQHTFKCIDVFTLEKHTFSPNSRQSAGDRIAISESPGR